MKHAKILLIISLIILVLGSLSFGYGKYLSQPYQGARFFNPYTKSFLYPYKDILVLYGMGIVALGIILAIGGIIGLREYSKIQGQHHSILSHFIRRRVLFYLLVLIVVLIIGFILMRYAPDPSPYIIRPAN